MSERWTPFFFGEDKQNAVLDERDRLVAAVGSIERGGDESKDADVNLVAASPQLLSSLEALIKGIDDWNEAVKQIVETPPDYEWGDLEHARRVVAKARGEEE